MADDVLDKEVSVAAELSTSAGLPVTVKGKAKLRCLAAADRLLGNILDFPNAWLEAKPAIKRAETKAAVEAIQKNNLPKQQTAFIQAAVDTMVAQAVRNQEKKILLLQEAVEDLKQRPPEPQERTEDAEQLDEAFLNRMEKQAELATEEEIRAKWGKVLAAEIRKPGTFSAKVLRIVDELEPQTAELFEKICRYRIGDGIITCLSGELGFSQRASLVNAELLIGTGNTEVCKGFVNSREAKIAKGTDFGETWIANIGDFYIVLPNNIKISGSLPRNAPVVWFYGNEKPPSISAYALTEAGLALASVMNYSEKEAFNLYMEKLSYYLYFVEIKQCKLVKDKLVFEYSWKNGKPMPQKGAVEAE